MGYYYNDQAPPGEEKPPGCLETLVIIRIVLGVLVVPLAVIIGVFVFAGVVFWAFTVQPALALIPLGLGGVALWLFSRWEQRRFRPPGG